MIAPLSIPSPPPSWQSIPIDLFGLHWDIRTYALIILVGPVYFEFAEKRRASKDALNEASRELDQDRQQFQQGQQPQVTN